MMDIPKRSAPTPRAQRIWEEIESLTLYDLLYLRDQMVRALGPGSDEEGSGGVREPRRPLPPAGTAGATVTPIMFETDQESLSSVWFQLGPLE
jgi:hypothetical protein